jgi:hypothetical protein
VVQDYKHYLFIVPAHSRYRTADVAVYGQYLQAHNGQDLKFGAVEATALADAAVSSQDNLAVQGRLEEKQSL